MSRPKESSIVSKCALIMDVISQARQPLPFAEIVTRTGFVKSSCHRVLAVLQSEDMISYDKDSRTYFTGPRLKRWARSSLHRTDLQGVSVHALDALSEATGMNGAVSIHDDEFILYLRTTDHLSIRLAARAGDRAPLHCTAAGKVFLAHMSIKRRADTLATMKLEKFTEFTLTEAGDLEAQMQAIRTKGYAMALREEYLHVIGMAAPIWNAQGSVTAALSLWTMTENATPEELERQSGRLIAAASDISSLIGWDHSSLQRA